MDRSFPEESFWIGPPPGYPAKFNIDPSVQLCCVYFPTEISATDSVESYTALKSAMLFFDKVFVVVPELILSDHFCSYQNMSAIYERAISDSAQSPRFKVWLERTERIVRFIDQTKSAHDAGVLTYVNPHQILGMPLKTHFYSLTSVTEIPVDEVEDRAGEVLFRSIVADLNDASFRRMVQASRMYENPGFAVFKDQGEINWLSMLGRASSYEEDHLVKSIAYLDPGPSNTSPDVPVVQSSPAHQFDASVSPVLGTSVMLSHVLAFSLRNSVQPLTDSRHYWDLLNRKFKRTNLASLPALTNHRIASLGAEVLRLELPQLAFSSFDDVLVIRHNKESELVQFRLALAKFLDVSSSGFMSDDLMRESNDIAIRKVRPALAELELSLRESKNAAVLKGFKDARLAAPIPIIAALMTGIPLIYSLAISAGLVSVDTFAEYYRSKKEIRGRNGLALLLDLQSALG